jgi:UDP-N-acetylmuramoylalanine--D-glutamate ligase
MESVKPETIWIVGGEDKGNNYSELLPLVNEKVKAIICIGRDNSKIKETFGNCVDYLAEAETMHEAVGLAYQISESGNTVLLSPACASFDRFENFEDRGRQFKNSVRNL